MGRIKITKDLLGVAYYVVTYGTKEIIAAARKKSPDVQYQHALNFYGDVLNFLKIDIKSSGLENLIAPPAIIIGNHTTHLDFTALSLTLSQNKEKVRFAVKKSLFKIPLLGQAMKGLGMVETNYVHVRQTMRDIDKAIKKIKQDSTYFVMFPEGTRTTLDNYQMLPFKRGPFQTAIKYELPIIPVASFGGQEILKKKEWEVKPGTIHLHVLPAIYPDSYNGDEKEKIKQLSAHAKKILEQGIEDLRNKVNS